MRMGGTVHADAKLRRALATGVLTYGERLPGLIAARLRAKRPSRGAIQASAVSTVPKLHRFATHPGDRVIASLPVGASYQVADGPQWRIIERPALRETP
jgi:hypothetical protein